MSRARQADPDLGNLIDEITVPKSSGHRKWLMPLPPGMSVAGALVAGIECQTRKIATPAIRSAWARPRWSPSRGSGT